MEVNKSHVQDVLILKPRVFEDSRGYFLESYNRERYQEYIGEHLFVQDNESLSSRGVVRGLHFQRPPFAQGKLVRVIKGAVLDVALDIRKDSPTYGQFHCEILSEENKMQMWIPDGFAHGFETLEDNTIFSYKCTNPYNVESEGSIYWNDPTLNIPWQSDNPIISEKDKLQNLFDNFNSPF
ncbi:MAG: dTDP-4-dehydrorhamnose 3,5-epimerase [Crocinitomicaceae bacterium]|nr:dTDP-4-dehydrorhamnose 3,5-epimerase [Crocinitomicaceae bacterium]